MGLSVPTALIVERVRVRTGCRDLLWSAAVSVAVSVSVSVPQPQPVLCVSALVCLCLCCVPVYVCDQLLEPFFKSPSMEERLAATSVASSFCARMSADLLGEGEAGGSMEEVLADVRKEWEVVAKTLFHGLYLGMNDLGMHLSSRCACAVEPRP